MAYQIGAMEIILRTDLDQLTSGMRNAAAVVDQSSSKMSRATQGASRSVGGLERAIGNIHGADSFRALTISALRAEDSLTRLKSAALLIPSLLGGASLALATKGLMDYADTATTVRNRLAVVLESQRDRVNAEREVFEISQRTRSQYSATANLYARTTQAAESLGRTQADILKFTEAVQKTNLISGSTTQESAAGAIQLAQGLASGRLQGDELRSILENNLELSNILAKELAGGSKGRLREMGAEGALDANAVLNAVLKNLDRIDKKFAQTQPTIAQGFVLIDNAITKYVGDIDKAIGASASFVKILASISNSVPELAAGLAGLGTIAAALFAGKLLRVAGSGISAIAADAGARRAAPVSGAAAAAEAARAAQNDAAMLASGAKAAIDDPRLRSVFTAADPDAVRRFMATGDALARANAKLSDAVDARDKLASKLEQINRQVAGADRQLSAAINADAAPGAKALTPYFKASFALDEAKSKLEGIKSSIADLKRERASAVDDMARSMLAGNEPGRRESERLIKAKDEGITRLSEKIPVQLQKIAEAEQRFAIQGARAVEAAEASKSKVINDSLKNRMALAEQRGKIEASLDAANGRVSSAGTTQMFAQSGAADARGGLERSAQMAQLRGLADYATAAGGLVAANQNAIAAQNALNAAVTRSDSLMGRLAAASGAAASAAMRLGSSLMAFVGGPWGVAFAGLSIALGVLAYRQATAATEAAKHKQALDDLPAAIERVNAAARAAQFAGTDPSRALVDEKAKLAQAQEAAKAQTQAFFTSLSQLAGQNAAALAQILRDAFNVQAPRGTSVLGILDEVQRMGPPTISQIQQVERAIQTLALNNGLNPKVAVEILKAGEEARRTQGLLDSLSRAVSNLDGARAKITIEMNVMGSFLNPQDSTRPSLRMIENEIMTKVDTEDKLNAVRSEGTTIADRRRAAEAKLQDELAKRQEYSRLPKNVRAAEELRDKFPGMTRESALDLLAREEAQSKSGKKSGGGSKSSEEKFDDRVKLLEAQGRAAFLTDRYRELIDQLKTLKSDPTLAQETLKAIEAGTALPERASKTLAAMDKKKAGELAHEFKAQYGSMGDAISLVEERQKLLNIAIQNGGLTTDQASEALSRYTASLPRFSWINKTADAFGDIAKQTANAALGLQTWDQALKNIQSSLTSMLIDEFLVEPLKRAVRQMLTAVTLSQRGGGGGGGGILGSIFGSLFGGGGTATGGPLSLLGAGAGVVNPMATGFFFHSGGTVGMGGVPVTAPAALWSGAPKFHSGLTSSEYPAILEYGERVLTENDARRSDNVMLGLMNKAANSNIVSVGGGVTINITNNSKAQVGEPQEQSSGGGKTIDVMIDDIVAGKINTPGSRTRTAMASNFGLGNQLRST